MTLNRPFKSGSTVRAKLKLQVSSLSFLGFKSDTLSSCTTTRSSSAIEYARKTTSPNAWSLVEAVLLRFSLISLKITRVSTRFFDSFIPGIEESNYRVTHLDG